MKDHINTISTTTEAHYYYEQGYKQGRVDGIEELGKVLCDELKNGYIFINTHQIMHFVKKLKEHK